MESWVWVLIGFIGGIVVYAILNLIFAKDPADEMEKLADERAAELAKAEMKTAVLQDKLVEAETARDEQRDKSEAEYQQKLREADIECQQKLAAAEVSYREQLAMVEQQFTNLETAFAQQAAELGAALTAAGLIAGAAASPEDTYLEELDQEFEREEDDLFATDDPELLDASLSTAAVAAALAGDGSEEEVTESTAKAYDEPLESQETYRAELDEVEESDVEAAAAADDEPLQGYQALAADLDEPGEGDAEVDAGLDAVADIEAEVAAIENEDEGAAKAAVAAAGVAAAAALSSDDEEDGAAVGDEETEFFAEADQVEEESSVMAEEPSALVEDDALLDDTEDAHAGLAAAVAAGTASAVLAASEGDEETGEVSSELAAEDGEAVPAVAELEPAVEEVDEQLEPSDDQAETPDLAEEDEVAAGVAAVSLASAMDEEDAVETNEEIAAEFEDEAEEATGEEEEALETIWPEDKSVWTGEYFNNMRLEGEPVLVREDAEIDFDWEMGSPAPEINADGFSVRWTRTADLPPGLYRFTVTSDDGARLWVNDRLVISAWYDHTEMTFRREIELPGGPVELKMEYYENEMEALVRVSWERIG